MQKINLYYAGQIGASGFGWATCNNSLARELSKLCHVYTEKGCSDLVHWDNVFMPLADHDFSPVSNIRGERNFAYTFFEFELGPHAAENAAKYDVVFCGSTWCLERMKERGITNGRVLIQGVDHDIFKPEPYQRTDNEFRIFSGGKFEYRKGQDIVIAAFRELSKKYDNMRLVTAWHNPWPQLIAGMKESPHLQWVNPIGLTQSEFILKLMHANGIDPHKVTVLPSLSQQDLAAVMNQTDLGVFPNRCEGGTNLVLMEYMACGKPVVASTGTGHADIVNASNSIPNVEIANASREGDWCEPAVWVVVERIKEWLDADRAKGGDNCRKAIQQFTWERAARTILDAVVEFQ